jgi:hypothetical protein
MRLERLISHNSVRFIDPIGIKMLNCLICKQSNSIMTDVRGRGIYEDEVISRSQAVQASDGVK